ncbi:MAG: hypothetical protein IKF52_03580 [Clostridia bacterium]|nr:hypothetical protein [Clostridia bacterium]
MKENSINEVMVDLNNMIKTVGIAEKPLNTTKEKSKYFISFSSKYEIFEDVDGEVKYENNNGEILLSLLNSKSAIFSSLNEYIEKTKNNINHIQKAVVGNLFDHYQYVAKLREDLEKCNINKSIIKMLCDDLNYYVNLYIQEQDGVIEEYNSNRKDESDLEELLKNEDKLRRFVELEDFDLYFEHSRDDIEGVKLEIKENIKLIEEQNKDLIEKNNKLLSGILNYLYTIISFFVIVDKQIDKNEKNRVDIEELLIEPLFIPRSETIFEKMPQTSKTSKNELEGQLQIVTKYELSSLDELLNIYIKDILENRLVIKKCQNCETYILPSDRQIYCEHCKHVPYEMRKNTDLIKLTYRNNYKNQHKKIKRNIENDPRIRQKFDKWNTQAKKMTKKCEEGKISLDELNEWFKNNENWKSWSV